ncbi:MAG TPA: hypothetical protein VFE53_08315 [Mucilaginibacter sp.]|jgi:hypothetical protein|nr:hypothetical protein [Mucilaginibacter sp.]
MNKQNELAGTIVLVKSNLSNNLDNKKQLVGVIVMASVENNSVMVNFGFDENAFFSTDALLVLRKPEEIRRNVLNDATLLPYYDYYDILDIISFAESPEITLHKEAVVLSSKNLNALEYTMISLSTVLGLKQANGINR